MTHLACHAPATLCVAAWEASFLALNLLLLYQMLSNPKCRRLAVGFLWQSSTLPRLGDFHDHDCILSPAVDLQDPSLFLKKDVERFLWNFLALRTSSGPAVAADGETLL